MVVPFRYAVLVFYTLLGLDSLLKVDLGFKLQLGLLVAVVFVVFCMLKEGGRLLLYLSYDKFLYVFMLYCFLTGVLFSAEGVYLVSVYMVFIFLVSLFVCVTFFSWNYRVFWVFQWVLLATGLFQYFLFQMTGYQLSFIDVEHYFKGFSVSERLRGFFVEPNWYSIALAFNTILLVRDEASLFIRRHWFMALLTVFVFLLNGTFATLGVLLLIYSYPVLRSNVVVGLASLIAISLLLVGILAFRSALSHEDAALFNYASRLVPLIRVWDYQLDSGYLSLLFGNGFGSWGSEAVYYRLSALVHDVDPSVRDGSELPVFLFEVGLFGVFLVFIDAFCLVRKAGLNRYFLSGGVLLFLVCFMFYPVYKFMMYMPYYFYIRQEILRREVH